MRLITGISGTLVLKSLSCRTSCGLYVWTSHYVKNINPCLFQPLSVPLFSAALCISDRHTTTL